MTNETTINSSVNSSDAGEQYILAKGDVVFESRGEAIEGGDETVGQTEINSNDLDFGNSHKRAQTFELGGDATLNNVSVHIKEANWDTIIGDISVNIYEDGGTHPGAVVATATISDGIVSTDYGWINVVLDYDLTGGTTYWLVLESMGCNYGGGYYWKSGFAGDYPGYYPNGEAWYYDGSSWTTNGLWGVDMTFELNITTEAQEAPVSTYTDRISMPDPDNFKFIAYYGWLNCTELNWSESGLELVLVRDDNEGEIQKVREAGVDVYFYIEIGQSYCEYNHDNDTETWEQDLISRVDNHTYVDGFFFDDLDPAFWTANISECGICNTSDLNHRLTNIIAHIHSNNQTTIVNGVRYYADHCGSDYYMWESFVSTHYSSGAYYYDDFFNGTASSGNPWSANSTDWINGVQKYEYLKDNGVLNRTLAHCYGPANEDNRSIYGYIASRVLGLKGFSYAEIHNFATEPLRIAEGLKWDLGTRMSYDIDSDAGNLSGRFTNGAVVDWVNQTVASNSSNYTTDMISDPLTAHLLDDSSLVTGLDFCLIRGQVDFMHGVLRSSTDLTGDPGYHVLSATLDAENGNATLHIDGTLAAKRTFPAGLPFDFSNQNLTIGSDGTCGFNGTIDDIKIYNYAT